MTTTPLPHPLTGECFPSPVPPGSGWPDDPAALDTPVARTPSQVRRASARMDSLPKLDAHVSVCRACPRLVKWREDVAANKRRAYLDQPYWGRPVTSLGPADAWLAGGGLGARCPRREPHRSDVHRGPLGRLDSPRPPPRWPVLPPRATKRWGRSAAKRRPPDPTHPLRAAAEQAHYAGKTHLPALAGGRTPTAERP